MSADISTFRTPREVHFGAGTLSKVGSIARRYGQRALLVVGARSARASGALAGAVASLEQAGLPVTLFDKAGREPTVAMVQEALDLARSEQCDVVVGVGGGSPIDVAKAVAGLFYSSHTVAQHFAGGAELPEAVLPWIAVPTTAGAGAEATPNAVLTDEATLVKQSLRSWSWLAEAAVVDPVLTIPCPKSVTAHSGMDAFTQAVESYTSRWATPLTESISFEAVLQVASGLPRAYADGADLEARTQVAWGATMAGIALANARLGAVHGFAHPVGSLCNLSHGLTCAIMLPWVVEYNMDAAGEKYARLARALGAAPADSPATEAAQAFLKYVRDLNGQLGIPRSLGEVGLREDMIDEIVEQTLPSGSLAANPKPVPREDLKDILLRQLS